ncbi:hypothetical protein C1Y47_21455 [Priestia megaterium]|nr:hypothetical protein C1Y47_21455 [Priestia megaterium]
MFIIRIIREKQMKKFLIKLKQTGKIYLYFRKITVIMTKNKVQCHNCVPNVILFIKLKEM